MNGVRSWRRSADTPLTSFSSSSSSLLSSFFFYSHADRFGEVALRYLNLKGPSSFAVASFRTFETECDRKTGCFRTDDRFPVYSCVRTQKGNFNAWNSRPWPSRVTARDSLNKNTELYFWSDSRSLLYIGNHRVTFREKNLGFVLQDRWVKRCVFFVTFALLFVFVAFSVLVV